MLTMNFIEFTLSKSLITISFYDVTRKLTLTNLYKAVQILISKRDLNYKEVSPHSQHGSGETT